MNKMHNTCITPSAPPSIPAPTPITARAPVPTPHYAHTHLLIPTPTHPTSTFAHTTSTQQTHTYVHTFFTIHFWQIWPDRSDSHPHPQQLLPAHTHTQTHTHTHTHTHIHTHTNSTSLLPPTCDTAWSTCDTASYAPVTLPKRLGDNCFARSSRCILCNITIAYVPYSSNIIRTVLGP